MSLIFGRLTQDFINFQIIRADVDQGLSDSASLSEAAASFRKSTALDASYLVYIGITLLSINLR
jgi:ATP-binding cassette, subfamily B (MDR/TAP), member 1